MIITDRFVYLHQPKTGGTFVTSMLLRLHAIRWSPWLRLLTAVREDVVFRGRYGTLVYHNNKHGGRSQIPARHERPLVLGTVRNPYDLLVSQYEFGWWRRPEYLRYFRDVPGFARDYPHFPEIAFAEFVDLSEQAFQTMPWPDDAPRQSERPGLLTREFIRFYCRNPEAVLARLAGGIPIAALRAELAGIHFLRQSDLNRQLHDFLEGLGYPAEELQFILASGRIHPQGKGRGGDRSWASHYTPELLERIRRREHYLFDLFPEFRAPEPVAV